MKGFIFLILLLVFSCDKKEKINPGQNTESREVENSAELKVTDSLYTHPWFQYYQKDNPTFNPENFQLKQTSPISYQESSVIIMNKKGFNEIYKPFFVFNNSKTKYLDFDSYQWTLMPDGSAGFEADQQVNLVDFKKKEAKQIAFFGPSYWIEDAYWKGDSVAVVLGNSYDKVPFIMKYNFNKNEVKNYEYPDTLKIKTPYSKFRLRNKGIKVE